MRKKEFLWIYLILGGVASSLGTVINIYVLQDLLDSIVDTNTKTTFYLLCYLLTLCLTSISSCWINSVTHRLGSLLEKESLTHSLSKIASLKYSNYENPEVLDGLHYVIDNAPTAMQGKITFTVDLVRGIILLAGSLGYLTSISATLSLLTLLLFIPGNVLLVIAENKEMNAMAGGWKYYKLQKQYSGQLVNKEYAKEERLFKTFPILNSYWKKSLHSFYQRTLKSNLKERFLLGGITFLQFASLVGLLMLLKVYLPGQILTVGTFTAIATALFNMLTFGQSNFYPMISNYVSYKMWKAKHKKINQLPSIQNTGITLTTIRSVEFRDVWFRYDESKEYVLKGVSFRLEFPRKYGLVGENGSGKTTIIKLLLGLLSPQKGMILINSIPAQNYSEADRMTAFSCVFQDFVKYNFSLRENISLTNQSKKADYHLSEIVKRIAPGLLERLPQGLDTMIGNIHPSGINLSGGEWEKISICRALANQKDFLILDEPTAPLDPLSEVEVYRELLAMMSDQNSALIVTHRLGLVPSLDEVLVVKDGTIVGKGSHSQLLKECSYYERIFSTNEKWYTEV